MGTAGKILDTLGRYLICFLMLVYGLVKLAQAQFYCDYHWRDALLGQLHGQQLVWAMYAHAPQLERLLGAVEIGLGLLLLFSRTANLGTLLFVPFALHLVALNYFYEIAALPTALPLLAAGGYLLAWRWPALRVLWQPAAADRAPPPVRHRRWPATLLILVATALATLIVYNNLWRLRQDPELRGAWRLVEPSPTSLQKLYFEKGTQCVARDAAGKLMAGRYHVAGNQLRFSEFDRAPLGSEEPCSYRLLDPATLLITQGEQLWRWERVQWPPLDEPF